MEREASSPHIEPHPIAFRLDLLLTAAEKPGTMAYEQAETLEAEIIAEYDRLVEQYERVAAENAKMREATTRIHKMNATTEAYEGLLEQLEAERAAGGEWASIAGEQMARAKTAREVLTGISQLDGNLSARVMADRWLDSDQQASNPASVSGWPENAVSEAWQALDSAPALEHPEDVRESGAGAEESAPAKSPNDA